MIETILLLDQDSSLQFVIRQTVPANFPGILHATNIAQAQKIFTTVLIDVIICDYLFLIENNHETYFKILENNKNTKFILLANGNEDVELSFFEKFDFHVVNKKDIGRLNSVIRSLFLKSEPAVKHGIKI